MDKLPISLCLFVKNESKNIRDAIESVYSIVSEVVIVDTGSTDNTVELCKKYTNRVYQVGFTDFGSIRSLCVALASQPFILTLDADEVVMPGDWPGFAELISLSSLGVKGDNLELDKQGQVVIDSWAFRRYRWSDRWMTRREDISAGDDWQVRFFRNRPDRGIKYVRRVHETIHGCARTERTNLVIIHHFQNQHKSKEDLFRRQELYTRLYQEDLDEGVEHTEPPVADADRVF